MLRLLKQLKAVRGTPFNLLGRTHVRRIERALIRQYRAMVEASLARLSGSGYPQAVRLAGLVDLVRGYEGVKLANIETYKAEVAQLAQDIGVDPAFGPEFGLVPVPARQAGMKSG